MEPGSGDKLAKLTLQLRETCLKKVWLTSISNCGMETYCTVISFASHHLQSFALTQRYELAGTDKQPPLHLPDLINKCNSHSKWCTEQCVCVCVCKEWDCITGSVMLHIMANEAGDIQTFYICKLKHDFALPAVLTGLLVYLWSQSWHHQHISSSYCLMLLMSRIH